MVEAERDADVVLVSKPLWRRAAFMYAIYRKDRVFGVEQSTGASIYLRNIYLRNREHAKHV